MSDEQQKTEGTLKDYFKPPDAADLDATWPDEPMRFTEAQKKGFLARIFGS